MSNNLPLIYIAGSFRAKLPGLVELNVRAAEEAALHCMYRNFNGTVSDPFWLEATLSLLMRCDAVLLLDGWRGSSGSMAEKAWADGHKIPVFESLGALQAWMEERR